MRSIMIRKVSTSTLRALKRLARSHHRSLQEELRVIPERAAQLAPASGNVGTLDLITVKTSKSSSWSRDEIYRDDGR